MSLPDPTHDSPMAVRARRLHRGFGWCGRCGFPWSVVESHTTWYKRNDRGGQSGAFPLCVNCWTGLISEGAAEAIIGHYRDLIEHWRAEDIAHFGPDEERSLMEALTKEMKESADV